MSTMGIPIPNESPRIKPKLVDPAEDIGVEERVKIVKWLEVIVWVVGFQDKPSFFHVFVYVLKYTGYNLEGLA